MADKSLTFRATAKLFKRTAELQKMKADKQAQKAAEYKQPDEPTEETIDAELSVIEYALKLYSYTDASANQAEIYKQMADDNNEPALVAAETEQPKATKKVGK
jgi:hypothetical protein